MKRLILLALLAAVAFAAYPNLQFAYRFQNSALDWSGNGRNGTVNGSGVYTTARGQQALYFDGTGDYVATPSFGLSGTVVVFATWVRCKFSATLRQSFLGDDASSVTVGHLWCRRNANSDGLRWQYAEGTVATGAEYVTFFSAPYDNVWVHAVVACDYPAKSTTIHRNGTLVATVAMSGTPVFPSTDRVKYIGSYSTGQYMLTDGYMANVQLWTLATMPPLAVMDASVKRIAAGLMPVW